MRNLSKILLGLYVLLLLWLVFFKFSYDIFSVLFDHQMRTINLVPFTNFSRGEVISNFIVFIPFGLLLGVNLKQTTFWQKLAFVFSFSLATEIVQYILAIGVTDVTDLIMNTLGGLLGLMLYNVSNKYVSTKKQDQFIVISGMVLFVLFILLRFFVFKVRY